MNTQADPEEFVKRETDWIGVPLKEDRPFLGICLGAQKLVRHLGGTVWQHPEELVEIGYYPLEATSAGKALLDWPEMIYHFHREGCDLPAGAELLATAEHYPNQAFRYGEKTYAFLARRPKSQTTIGRTYALRPSCQQILG